MYICITHIDASTKIICTIEPMRTGPIFPDIKNLQIEWWDSSTWPIKCTSEGAYTVAPKYYGTCDDDADINISGVLEILSEPDFMQRKRNEFYARKPFESWIFDESNLSWNSPIPYPEGAKSREYRWDEETMSWVTWILQS